MARFKDEESRLAFYVNKYGEEEGRRRYEEAVAKDTPSDPMADQQGSILGSGERTPRRRGRKPNPREVYTAVASAVYMADTGACFLFPAWVEDRLTQQEIGALGQALGDEIMSSEYLTRMLMKAQTNSVHVKLAYTVAMIAIPRMAKHGMIPAGFIVTEDTSAETDTTPVPMEAGAAHGDRGDDGIGQVNTGEQDTGNTEIPSGAEEQSGRRDVPWSTERILRFNNGRPTGLPVGAAPEVGESTE